jgi:hypothetical protein
MSFGTESVLSKPNKITLTSSCLAYMKNKKNNYCPPLKGQIAEMVLYQIFSQNLAAFCELGEAKGYRQLL